MRIDYDSYIGKKINKLTIDKVADFNGQKYFYCTCECGNHTLVLARNVLRGLTKSCGCIRAAVGKERAISEDVVEEILTLRASGLSFRKIGERVGFSGTAVWQCCKTNEATLNRIIKDYGKIKDFNSAD